MKVQVAALVVVGIWATIYLPGLGIPEYKGEEPRRVQPALAMLDTGNWLTPHIGGEVYMNKPPAINWAVAAVFIVGADRNEWLARLPSVLSVLAVALTLAIGMRPVAGAVGAFAAAVFLLTHIGLMEKGRLIEIEALYIALFGIALLWWVRAHLKDGGQNGAMLWLGPWVLLAAGVLTKGPPHLGFFYFAVALVLWRLKNLRILLSPWHFASIAAGIAIVAAWVVPFFLEASGERAVQTWYNQIAVRVAGEGEQLQSWDWLWNIPKGLGNFMPWTVLLPLLWLPGVVKGLSERESATFRGLRDATAILYIGIGALPGVAPRYLMPLLVVPCLLLGWRLGREGDDATIHRIWRTVAFGTGALVLLGFVVLPFTGFRPEPVSYWMGLALTPLALFAGRKATLVTNCLLTGIVMGTITFGYCAFALPRIVLYDNVRPVYAGIEARTAEGATLAAVDPGSRPFLAYARPGFIFAKKPEDLPPGELYVIDKASRMDRYMADDGKRIGGRKAEVVWEFSDREKDDFVLLRLVSAD